VLLVGAGVASKIKNSESVRICMTFIVVIDDDAGTRMTGQSGAQKRRP
jgi:hypothetical protein